jgi:hypothetical protein
MNAVVTLMDRAAALDMRIGLNLLANDALITRSRAAIVAAMLDNPAATHLLFVDADISFPPEQVARLVAFDKDIVAATYPVKTIDWSAIPARHVQNHEPLSEAGLVYVGKLATGAAAKTENDFATADYAGTGFMLISRAALLRMIAAYPETKYKAVQSFPPSPPSDHLYALFDCMIDTDGAYLSEDYAFCKRWRALGGEIWLDRTSSLTHTGPYSFAGNAASRFSNAS